MVVWADACTCDELGFKSCSIVQQHLNFNFERYKIVIILRHTWVSLCQHSVQFPELPGNRWGRHYMPNLTTHEMSSWTWYTVRALLFDRHKQTSWLSKYLYKCQTEILRNKQYRQTAGGCVARDPWQWVTRTRTRPAPAHAHGRISDLYSWQTADNTAV